MKIWGVMATCTSILCAHSVHADQPMHTLKEIISQGDYAEPYIAERCAGLWISLAKWGGEAQWGNEKHSQLVMTAQNLIEIAATSKSNRAGTSDQERQDLSTNSALLIAQRYLDRFSANYTATGSAFGKDTNFQDDMDICTELSAKADQ